jgi:uroporphyrinogen decarboxylase
MASGTSGTADFRALPFSEMQAIVKRFDQRVNAGLKKAPATKEVVKRAVRRQNPPFCPCRLNRLSYDVILRHGKALADIFYEYPDDIVFAAPYHIFVGYQPAGKPDTVVPLKVLMEEAQWTDEWGTRWAHAYGGVGGTPVDSPIRDWSQLEHYIRHRMPDAHAPDRMDAAAKVVRTYQSTKYCMGTIQAALFERIHFVRGMENVFEDVYACENEVRRLADAITAYNLELIAMWGKIGVDSLLFTDDWGTQTALMISPAMWRKLFKPYYKTLFDAVHREGMDVCLHSCGNVTEIVGDLIDIGLDVLDPVQPGAMNVEEIARNFGGHITFHGAIDDQHLMTSFSPQKIKDTIRWLIDTLGRPFGNGFILCPGNSIPPETPIENLRALFEACHER